MTVTETIHDPPEHTPPAAELVGLAERSALVVLPDSLATSGGQTVAGFRHGTQELRIAAREAGVEAEVLLPPGADAGHYSEHDADWVLPLILSVPGSVIATLIATQIQSWQRKVKGGERTPTVRYREIFVEDGRSRLREIEGPADEVIEWLHDSERTPIDEPARAVPSAETAREEDPPERAP